MKGSNIILRAKKPQCPYCESKSVLFRQRSKEFYCRKCGEVFKKADYSYVNYKQF
jgi:ribosomal protein L37AE/L43A